VLVGGVAGQTIEFYEYALYGLLAVPIGKHFFPSGDPTIQLLSAFALFGAHSWYDQLGAWYWARWTIESAAEACSFWQSP
jgi:MFS transporter, MHS family, proline/betaine transporter